MNAFLEKILELDKPPHEFIIICSTLHCAKRVISEIADDLRNDVRQFDRCWIAGGEVRFNHMRIWAVSAGSALERIQGRKAYIFFDYNGMCTDEFRDVEYQMTCTFGAAPFVI